jgi:hypothetical protein
MIGGMADFHWREFRNDSGETIPPFSCVRITGAVIVETGRVTLKVGKPNTYGAQYSHAFTGPVSVADGKYGLCTRSDGAVAVYDDADGTPAFGELWGPRDATWKLKKNTPGFVVDIVTSTANKLVTVRPCPFLRFHGVTDAAHNKDASGTVSIWYGTGAGTDSTVNMASVYNAFGNVASGKDVECVWEGDVAGTSWKFVAAECS